jgi:hypothetical protein
MKNLIKEMVHNALLEVAKSPSDLSETTGLFNAGDYLVLYDYKTDRIYAVIGINKSSAKASPVNNPDKIEDVDFYYFGAVAAEKGYGPLIYEMAMSEVYPLGLVTDRDSGTSDKAYNVLKRMYERGLAKYQIIPGDDSYMTSDRGEEYDTIINAIYYYGNKNDYNKLIAIGNEFLSQKENPKSFLKSLNERASHFFFARLDESKDKTIKCRNCGWHWKKSQSKKEDLYLCHKCGYNTSPRIF